MLSQNDLCYLILSQKPITNTKLNNISDSIQRELNSMYFPNYSADELKHIRSKLAKGDDFVEVLLECNFLFTFRPSFLELIINDSSLIKSSPSTFIIIVLYSFLSWCQVHKKRNDSQFLFPVLSGLCALVVDPSLKDNAVINTLSVNAIYYSYKLLLKSSESVSIHPFLAPLHYLILNTKHQPECFLSLVCDIGENILKGDFNRLTNEQNGYVSMVNDIIETLKSTPEIFIDRMIPIISPLYYCLNPQALVFFSNVFAFLSDDLLKSIVRLIIAGIFNESQHCESVYDLEANNMKKESSFSINGEHYFDIAMRFKVFAPMEPHEDNEQFPVFPPRLPYTDLLNNELLHKLGMIIGGTIQSKKFNTLFVEILHEEFMKCEFSLTYDVMASFLYLIAEILKSQNIHVPEVIVGNKIIFDPSITIYSCEGQAFSKINTLRQIALDIMLNQSFQTIKNLLSQMINHPLLFSETIHRLGSNPFSSYLKFNEIPVFSQSILFSMFYYQSCINLDDQLQKSVSICRYTLFWYLDKCLSDFDYLFVLFQDTFFLETYPSFLFEKSARHYVLKPLLRYLVTSNALSNTFIHQKLIQIVTICCNSVDNNDNVDLINDLICVINEACIHIPDLSIVFEPMIEKLCNLMVILQKGELSSNFIINTLSFVTENSAHYKINNPILSAIESSIKTVFGEDPPSIIFNKMVQLIAGTPLPSIHPSFRIYHSKALRILLELFLKSTSSIDTIKFLYNLCEFSSLNCISAHESSFDIYLIDVLNRFKSDLTLNEIMISKIFELFFLISSELSSIGVVRHFVSLLCLVDSRYFPPFHNITLKYLNNIFQSSTKKPSASLPYEEKASFRINGMKADLIEHGFTISLWILNNTTDPHYKPLLFCIQDSKNQEIGCYMSSGSLIVFINHFPSSWTGKADFNIPLKKWTFVSLSFVFDNTIQKTFVYPSFDGNEPRIMFFPYHSVSPGILSAISIGGVYSENDVVDYKSRFGPAAVFSGNIDADLLRALFDAGPVNSLSIEPKPVLYASMIDCNGLINVQTANLPKNACVLQPESKINAKSTFIDVFVNKCGVDVLLPLFAQWNLGFISGNKIPFYGEITIEILESALLISQDGQRVFQMNNGFKIISHLLHSNSSHITYQIYQKLFSLLGNIQYIELQKQLLSEILLNLDIWILCDPDSHQRIIKHWSHTLYPSKKQFVIEILSFEKILSFLRVYYWYEPNEEGIIKCFDSKKHPINNVSSCRKNLFMIAHFIVRSKFSNSDFKLLLSHILTCADYRQTLDLLHFLKEIVSDHEYLNLITLPSVQTIPLLQYLFNIQDDGIIFETISILIDCHKYKLLNHISLDQHINIIHHQLTSSFIRQSLFHQLISLLEKAPELFSLVSWMAINLGEDSLRYLLTKTQPSLKFQNSPYWYNWIIIGVYYTDEKLQNDLIDYIIKSIETEYASLFSSIEMIGLSLKLDPDQIKSKVLYRMGEMIIKLGHSDIVPYYHLIRHFILFRREEIDSGFSLRLFKTSPYSYVANNSIPFSQKRLSPKKRMARKARHSLKSTIIMDQSEGTEVMTPEYATKALNLFSSHLVAKDEVQHGKRTSMIIQSPLSFRSSSQGEKQIISMMPGDMIEILRTRLDKSLIYCFGLRISGNGMWIDENLAKQAIEVFDKFPDQRCSEIVIILLSYLSHDSGYIFDGTLRKIQTNIFNQLSYSLLYHHMFLTKRISNSKVSTEVFKNSLEFSEKLSKSMDKALCVQPLKYLKTFHKYQEISSNKAYEIFAMISDEVVSASTLSVSDYNELVEDLRKQKNKMWSRFWLINTSDHAPWNKSISAKQKGNIKYKRDSTHCYCFCPMKMKRNYAFDDHQLASMLRDSGSDIIANEKCELYRQHLADEYAKNAPPPLFEVIEQHDQETSNNSMNSDESVLEFECEEIKIEKIRKGKFILRSTEILILFENGKRKAVLLNEILHIFFRTRYHHPTAIEIFTIYGEQLFINFINIKSIPIIKYLKNFQMSRCRILQTSDFKPFFDGLRITENWINRDISNFEYLMNLNILSGRSFNDASQYPIMPWVLQDYESNVLNIDNPSIYRDLSKPIGSINESRLKKLSEKMEQLVESGNEPYLYSSGLMCPLSVYHWLLRMEPFTTLHIEMQSGCFDHSYRQFSSISRSFEACLSQNNNYKELIPEFYYQPEFLVNSNSFDLGNLDDEQLNHSGLPNWASTPFEFVYLHRKALESEFVSKNIHKWIDLVWGSKQNSEIAFNTYPKQMYYDIWSQKGANDPESRANIEAILCHVGQIPPKLFERPHPVRSNNISSVSVLSRPVSVSIHSCHSIISSIRHYHTMKYKVAIIDEMGIANISIIDLNHVNKLSRSEKIMMRSRSGSTKMFPLSPKKKNERHSNTDAVLLSPLEILCQNDFNVSLKNIKGISSFLNQKSLQYCFSSRDDSFYVVFPHNTYDLYRIKVHSSTCEFFMRQQSEIVHVSCSGEWLAVVNKDAILSIFNTIAHSSPKFVIHSFSNSIKCISISEVFHTCVIGTRDESLIFCSISNGRIIKTINLNGRRPLKILITPSWGFIIVYQTHLSQGILHHELATYSINGEFIRSSPIDRGVSSWYTFKNTSGFDYVLMTDDLSYFFIFEAFYLDVGRRFFSISAQITDTLYDTEESVVVALTKCGKVIVIPFQIE